MLRRVPSIAALSLAAAALFFALWPVLADAPWESSTEVVPTSRPAFSPKPAPTSSLTADRRNCGEIRGTQYRSVTERSWFLANCTTFEPLPARPPVYRSGLSDLLEPLDPWADFERRQEERRQRMEQWDREREIEDINRRLDDIERCELFPGLCIR